MELNHPAVNFHEDMASKYPSPDLSDLCREMKKIFNELQKHNSEHLKILEGTRKTLEKEHERRQKLLEIHDKRMTIELDQILSRIDRKISAFYGLDIMPFENTEVAYANIADMNLTTQVFASIIE